MKRLMFLLLVILIVSLMILIINYFLHQKENQSTSYYSVLAAAQNQQIEEFVETQRKMGKIPGISVVIVKDQQILYQRGFGYADLQTKRPVTSETYFEMGSNSKAFTGLGVLRLEKEGLIVKEDNVRKYLPWFWMNYVEITGNPTIDHLYNFNRKYFRWLIPWFKTTKEAPIKICDLLRHNSGIPSETINDIPVSDRDDALEQTVRTLVGQELNFPPNTRFLYATINYDVLGLIIQQVSQKPYEVYMKENVLEPLGLTNTYMSSKEVRRNDLATGYKISFLRPLKYNAPVFRGNTPAAYIVTNSRDLGRWLLIQLGSAGLNSDNAHLISESHQDSYAYSYGWEIDQTSDGKKFWHRGANPNYSSYISFRTQDKMGVGILANANSYYTERIGDGLFSIVSGQGRLPDSSLDMILNADIFLVLVILAVVFTLTTSSWATWKRYHDYYKFVGINKKNILAVYLLSIGYVAFIGLIYFLPDLLFGYPWRMALVWGPVSFPVAIGLFFIQGTIWFIYLVNWFFFKGKKVKQPRRKFFFTKYDDQTVI